MAACLFGAWTESASANTRGGYYLRAGYCCDGAGLYGSRASITTPVASSHWSWGSTNCVIARSASEIINFGERIINAGFVRCNPPASVDGTCGASGALENFVEVFPYGSYPSCYTKGVVGYNTTHLYTVAKFSGQNWYAYIDGVADTHPLTMGGAEYLDEGTEWTSGCNDSFSVYADWAYSTPWQRYTSSGNWYTVQSASPELPSCGWWTIGSPPNHWQVNH